MRRVEPRNTPTTVNAVFNHSNFWDGRAHNLFNGVSIIGPLDRDARIWVARDGALVQEEVRIPNSSLASQALGPPVNDFEMSFLGRTFPDIGRKLLSLRPLGLQLVHPRDSVLGKLSQARLVRGEVVGGPGLRTTYANLIMRAFRPNTGHRTRRSSSKAAPTSRSRPISRCFSAWRSSSTNRL